MPEQPKPRNPDWLNNIFRLLAEPISPANVRRRAAGLPPMPASPALAGRENVRAHSPALRPRGPAQSPQPAPRTVGPNGWVPGGGDRNLLARMIFAEGSNTPEDYEALGWAIVNRAGDPRHGRTLSEVLNERGQYSFIEAGGAPPGGSAQWRITAQPDQMTGANAASWRRAQAVAAGIVDGVVQDPTGGATHYFASDRYRPGSPRTAPDDWYRSAIGRTLAPSAYRSAPAAGPRNYFFAEPPPNSRR